MAQQPQWVQRAMDLAIKRVRFEEASFILPGHQLGDAGEDTEAIKEATKPYMATWVIPILEATRDGDTKRALQHL